MLPFDSKKHLLTLKLLPQNKHSEYMQHLIPQIQDWISLLMKQVNKQLIPDDVLLCLLDHIMLHIKPIFEESKHSWLYDGELLNVGFRSKGLGVDYIGWCFYFSEIVRGKQTIKYQLEPREPIDYDLIRETEFLGEWSCTFMMETNNVTL